jgi:hypothetical protein
LTCDLSVGFKLMFLTSLVWEPPALDLPFFTVTTLHVTNINKFFVTPKGIFNSEQLSL